MQLQLQCYDYDCAGVSKRLSKREELIEYAEKMLIQEGRKEGFWRILFLFAWTRTSLVLLVSVLIVVDLIDTISVRRVTAIMIRPEAAKLSGRK